MLSADDRTTLIGQIRPPSDARLTHLLGTTFTLDLVSALLPPLAVSGSSSVLGSSDPLEVLAALRTTVDRIDIFHQCGQIPVPQTPSRIMSLLEPSLHGVRHRHGYLFHPKIWIARYERDDESIGLRMLILTRNLTQDKSWDLIVALDGFVSTSPKASNRSLSKLIEYLPSTAVVPLNSDRRSRLTELAHTIRYAEWSPPEGVTEMEFHIFGVPGVSARPDFSGRKHLIVSPFLGAAGLERLTAAATGAVSVVSTQDALDQLDVDVLPEEAARYVLAPAAGVPEDDASPSAGTILKGLHAKVYCIERGLRAHVFAGSANATDAAFNGNVEILVELRGGIRSMGVDALLSPDSLGKIIVPIQPVEFAVEDLEAAQRKLDAYLRTVAAVQLQVKLARDGDECQMQVSARDPLPSRADAALVCAPLTRPELAQPLPSGETAVVEFTDLALIDTTAFLILRVNDAVTGLHSSTVVKARLINDLSGRLNAVVSNEIKTPEAFLRLLRLLLALGMEPADDGVVFGSDADRVDSAWRQMESGLFEMLVRTASVRPEAIDKVRGVVEDLISAGDPDSVLPPGFAPMWAAIATAASCREHG